MFGLYNRIVNPVVRPVLRSPLHGLFSRGLMLLTFRGRRSGRSFTIPVQYAREGDTVIVYPGRAAEKTWWRNLREAAPVRLHILGADVDGIGQAISGDADPEEMARGLGVFLRRFPGAGRGLSLEKGADAEAIRGVARNRVIVRIQGVQGARP